MGKKYLENLNKLVKIENALKKNLGTSIPYLEEIIEHIRVANQNFSRSLFVIKCAGLFRSQDQKIFDIGTTLEFLHTASLLHRNLNEIENSRRLKLHVKKILGSEASVLIGDYLLSISFRILTSLGNLDILECISLATKNISRGQVLEISEQNFLANPKHWYKVIRYKIAGLYGAGAQSAAFWGNASQFTASNLFSFGVHFGIASELKKDLNAIFDKKIIQQKLKDKELWSPFSFLIYDCMSESENKKIIKKLRNNFDFKDMSEEIYVQFKKYELNEILITEIKKELREADFFLDKMEIDTTHLKTLTNFSNI